MYELIISFDIPYEDIPSLGIPILEKTGRVVARRPDKFHLEKLVDHYYKDKEMYLEIIKINV